MLKLIVGLGNPGDGYQATRHNAGFWVVDKLAAKLGWQFSLESKHFAYVAKGKICGHDLYLMKPQTYMNLSGKAVHSLAGFYKIQAAEVLVIHDELDFAPGICKLKYAGGNGGHNGLKDIERVLGRDYWRLRVGIGHPGVAAKVVGYVLQKPLLAEQIEIEAAVAKVIGVSDLLINADFANAQKKLHSRLYLAGE